MKALIIVFALLGILVTMHVQAGERQSSSGRTYGDAWYDLERKYPSPERRYSRRELDQARRRANNSLWMENNAHKDPIYQSDQYRGRSSGYNSSPYRYEQYRRNNNYNRYGHQW